MTDINLNLENTRRDLIALRVAHGADTPMGFVCSNIIGQIENLAKATDETQREFLLKFLNRSMETLTELKKGMQ